MTLKFRLTNISIKTKLVAISAIVTIGMVAILSATLSINHSNDSLQRVSESKINLLTLRRIEKDFLSRKNDKYLEKHKSMVSLTNENLMALKEDFEMDGANEKTLQALDNYRTSFAAIASLYKLIGYDHETGLRGDLRRSVHEVESVIGVQSQLLVSLLMLRRAEKDFLLRHDKKYLEKFERAKNVFLADLDRLGSKDSGTKIKPLFNNYTEKFVAVVDAYEQIGLSESQGKRGEMRKAAHQLENSLEQLHGEMKEALASSTKFAFNIILLVLAITLISVFTLTHLLSISVIKPIRRFAQQIKQISVDKDLSYKMPNQSNNEIGEAEGAFNDLLGSMKETILGIDTSVDTVNDEALTLNTVTDHLRSAAESEMNEIKKVSYSVDEMSRTIQDIAANAVHASENVQEIHNQLQEGTLVGENARAEIEILTNEIQGAATAIQELSENSHNIGYVLDAITSVAEQTNLLALNAAIEAARAGEQGRGFAVVADEVRTLAQRTQDSTETIRNTISEFQQRTEEVVAIVDRSNRRAETGIQEVRRSSEILNNIAGVISQINTMNLQIATNAEQQGANALEINKNILRIIQLSQKVMSQTNSTAAAGQEMLNLSANVKFLIEEFKVDGTKSSDQTPNIGSSDIDDEDHITLL